MSSGKAWVKTALNSLVIVEVANVNKLQCDKSCIGLKSRMQGKEFQGDLLVLPLEGWQVVLRDTIANTVEPIVWDFKELKMEFSMDGEQIILRGTLVAKLQMIQGKNLMKAL